MKPGVVIPTRHRPALAISAIESLLAQPDDVSIIVSDNSSSEDQVRQLAAFCSGIDDPRLLYLRCSPVLPMPAHWDWALQQALARTDATHFGIQYDRMLWKADQLHFLAEACASAPDTLVTFGCDFTYPISSRFGAWQAPASGKLFEIRTSRVLDMTAQGMIYEMGHGFPILSNCMLPRQILEKVRGRFGDFCNSSSPDSAFTYRFCAIAERYRHLDRAAVIVHSSAYSNGRSLFRGDAGGTWGDFAKLWGDRPWVSAAPITEPRLGQNVVFHEYNMVRRAVGDERFAEINRAGYLRELARGLAFIADPERKAEMRALLESHGWREEPPPPRRPLYRRVLSRVRHPFPVRQRMFDSEAEAIAYLQNHPRSLTASNPLLAPMEPVEVRFSE
ncbi:MAG TPA: glycosyltransferase family A protein [Thermoanaerobaculia bacterium]|jgi:hypothetical protein|nr:glycosyltransferase family A protein [Thermoanaerobaculia bacterium]